MRSYHVWATQITSHNPNSLLGQFWRRHLTITDELLSNPLTNEIAFQKLVGAVGLKAGAMKITAYCLANSRLFTSFVILEEAEQAHLVT